MKLDYDAVGFNSIYAVKIRKCLIASNQDSQENIRRFIDDRNQNEPKESDCGGDVRAAQERNNFKLKTMFKKLIVRFKQFLRVDAKKSTDIDFTKEFRISQFLQYDTSDMLRPRFEIPPTTLSECLNAWPRDKPLISVVITSFNYGNFLPDAVESVLNQTFNDIEVIIVEGGSTDGHSSKSALEFKDIRVRVLLQTQPTRAGANRNLGISHARGKYICCLDADDRLHPTYLEKTLFFIDHYGFDVVSSGLQFFGCETHRLGIKKQPTLEDMLEGNHVFTCALFRKELWRKAGGYRDSIDEFCVYEDWLFWVRLAGLGARFWNISGDFLFFYRKHGSSLSSAKNILPLEQQKQAISKLNADLINEKSIARSKLVADYPIVAAADFGNLHRISSLEWRGPAILLALSSLNISNVNSVLEGLIRHLSFVGWRVVVILPTASEAGTASSEMKLATNEVYSLPAFLDEDQYFDFVKYIIATRKVSIFWIWSDVIPYHYLDVLRHLFNNMVLIDSRIDRIDFNSRIEKVAVDNKEFYHFSRSNLGIFSFKFSDNLFNNLTNCVETQCSNIILSNIRVAKSGKLCRPKLGIFCHFDENVTLHEIDLIAHFTLKLTLTSQSILMIFCSDEIRNSIRDILRGRNVGEEKIFIIAEPNEFVEHVRKLDLLCLPYTSEVNRVFIEEAVSHGLPIAAADNTLSSNFLKSCINGPLRNRKELDIFVNELLNFVIDNSSLNSLQMLKRQSVDIMRDCAILNTHLAGTLLSISKGDNIVGN